MPRFRKAAAAARPSMVGKRSSSSFDRLVDTDDEEADGFDFQENEDEESKNKGTIRIRSSSTKKTTTTKKKVTARPTRRHDVNAKATGSVARVHKGRSTTSTTSASNITDKNESSKKIESTPANINTKNNGKKTPNKQRVFRPRKEGTTTPRRGSSLSPTHGLPVVAQDSSPRTTTKNTTKTIEPSASTTSTTTHTTNTTIDDDPVSMIDTLTIPALALAVDARRSPDFFADAACTAFLSRCRRFLRAAVRRRTLPSVIGASAAVGGARAAVATTTPVHLAPVVVDASSLDPSSSWSHYGDLADAVLEVAAEHDDRRPPLDLVVLAPDAALSSRADDVGAHAEGLAALRRRLAPRVAAQRLRSVEIVVVEVGDNDGTERLARARLVRELRRRAYDDADGGVVLRVRAIDGDRAAAHRLLRDWTRRHKVTKRARGRLTFALPETLDGSQCCVDLDLEPASWPVDDERVTDEHLCRFDDADDVEVVRVVPLSTIDPSLFVGVPSVARAATVDDDDDDRCAEETRVLVRALWKWCERNDAGLLLRSVRCGDGDHATMMRVRWYVLAAESREGTDDHANNEGDDRASRSPSLPPTSGILFRVSGEEEVLRDDEDEHDQHLGDDETAAQYYDHVERSLELLDRGGFNPLLLTSEGSDTEHDGNDGHRWKTGNDGDDGDDGDDGVAGREWNRWKETSGVGALERPTTSSSGGSGVKRIDPTGTNVDSVVVQDEMFDYA